MRNFKKILSLVLAMAMMLSVMVTGAGAAFKDEGDFSEEYVTAAEALTNLGVLWGYEDGSFQPKDTITRAETAALIYRMTTGDVTDSNKGNYTNMTNGFTDVKSADWFAGYVNFCANAQYVAGYGDGTFGPQKNVTGYQTLAMILRAVGYDKPNEFTGADWEVKTASFAQKLGILDNVKGSEKLGEPASRELVAELLFQAMATVDLVHYAPYFGYVDVDKVTTLGNKQFDLAEVEGFVYANEEANLETTNKVDALEDGKTWIKTDAGMEKLNLTTGTDIIGEQVSVWVAGDDAVSTPISLADTTTEWSNTTWKFLDDDALKAWDEATDKGTLFYNNYDYNKNGSAWDGKGVYIKAIDNDGDGTYEFVLAVKADMTTVKFVKTDGEIVLDGATIKNLDQFYYGGIAVDDVVLFKTFDGNAFIEKADFVTGYISGYDVKVKADDTVTIGGEAYAESAINPINPANFEIDRDNTSTYTKTYNGTTYNYYMDTYGNIVAYDKAGENAVEYGLILDYDVVENGAFEGQLTHRPLDGMNKGDLWVKYLTVDNKVEIAKVDLKDGDFAGNIGCGDVVEYRINDEGKFVVVYDIEHYDSAVGTIPSLGLAYILGDNMGDSEVDDSLISFYYYEINGGNDVVYGVLTGDEAINDLALMDETNTDLYKEVAQMVEEDGTLKVLNISEPMDTMIGFAYVDTFNTFASKLDEDGVPYYQYNAIDAAGNPIVLTTDAILNEVDGYVYAYLKGADGFNYLEDVEDLGFALIEGDLHARNAQLFSVKGLLDGYDLDLPVPACYVDADNGGTTTLSKEYCSYGYAVAFDVVINGVSVSLETPAVFVTDICDGDNSFDHDNNADTAEQNCVG